MSAVLRSVGAVLAGFAATFVLSIATDAVMHGTGVFPPFGEPMSDALFAWATAYRTVYTVLAGYITARLAANRPWSHALALGLLGTVAGTAGLLATWDLGPEFGPKWYPILLAVEAAPCVLAGAWLAPRGPDQRTGSIQGAAAWPWGSSMRGSRSGAR